MKLLKTELSSLLPDDSAQTQAIFQESLTAEIAAKSNQVHQDVVDAWSLSATELPGVPARGGLLWLQRLPYGCDVNT